MAYESLLNEALKLAKTFKIYPLAPMTNIPLKGSRGELDATQDQQTILSWFESEPLISIGISLKDSNVLVLDIDDHHEDGEVIKELAQLTKGGSLEDAVIVKTPRGQGFHAYYKYPSNITIENDSNFRNGIELLATKVTAPNSRKRLKDGSIGEYTLKSGSLSDIKPCPQWLLSAITVKQQVKESKGSYTMNYSNSEHTGKTWTATFLEDLVNGQDEPGRNNWLTSKAGKLLSLGVEPENCYQLLKVINLSFVKPPLPEKTVNTIFKSILKREVRKRGGEISE